MSQLRVIQQVFYSNVRIINAINSGNPNDSTIKSIRLAASTMIR